MKLLPLFLSLVLLANSYTPSEDDYNAYNELVSALGNNSHAHFILRELYFPSIGQSPICTPIKYELICDGSSPQNFSFLWTEYDTSTYIGQILVSFAYYGVIVRGFDWEESCRFFQNDQQSSPVPVLKLNLGDCSNQELQAQLVHFTAAVSYPLTTF